MAWEEGFVSKEIGTVIAESEQRYAAEIDQFRAINRRGVALQHEIKVKKGPAGPLMATVLYMRTLGHYQTSYLLARRGLLHQTRIMMRAMMETIFALRACLTSEDFALRFLDADQVNRKQFHKKMHDLQGTGFLLDAATAATPELLAEIEKAIEELDARHITAKELAQAAGLYPWYLSLYALFSSSVHSSVRSLESHLDGKSGELVNTADLSESGILIDTASDMFLVALESTSRFFGIDCDPFIRDQHAALHPRLQKERVGAEGP